MASTPAVIGIVACTSVLAIGLVFSGAAAVFGQRLAGTADAAALAAADAASGAVSGSPCARAGEIATEADAVLVECDIDGLIATVTVTAAFGGITASAAARAGPPP